MKLADDGWVTGLTENKRHSSRRKTSGKAKLSTMTLKFQKLLKGPANLKNNLRLLEILVTINIQETINLIQTWWPVTSLHSTSLLTLPLQYKPFLQGCAPNWKSTLTRIADLSKSASRWNLTLSCKFWWSALPFQRCSASLLRRSWSLKCFTKQIVLLLLCLAFANV